MFIVAGHSGDCIDTPPDGSFNSAITIQSACGVSEAHGWRTALRSVGKLQPQEGNQTLAPKPSRPRDSQQGQLLKRNCMHGRALLSRRMSSHAAYTCMQTCFVFSHSLVHVCKHDQISTVSVMLALAQQHQGAASTTGTKQKLRLHLDAFRSRDARRL